MTHPLIWILNGPNLNKLGTRQPDLYGKTTLSSIEENCRLHAKTHGFAIDFRQTNHEGVLIDWIQEAHNNAHGLIINAAGYTHTSIALMDALLMLDIPIIDVHLTNIFARESYRTTSLIASTALGVIAGFGENGYILAIDALIPCVKQKII
jgi:3-dehydroquinate dehydratase-2